MRSLLVRPLPVAVALLALACTGGRDGARGGSRPADSASQSNLRGVAVDPPYPKPDFTLTDADGRPFHFRAATEGKVTLLFFGYTHCPDVCPLHAANIAAVLRQVPFEIRDAIRFVFVTTDPARDTPARLKEWLGNFDPTFIGLTGSADAIARIQSGLHLPPAARDPAARDSAEYLVGHAAQVLAFGTDDTARVEYPFGIRQIDWANDLPRLVRGERPAPRVPGSRTGATSRPSSSPESASSAVASRLAVRVIAAVVPQPRGQSEAALYLLLQNGDSADTLQSVASPLAARAELHQAMGSGATSRGRMTMMSSLPMVAGQLVRLVPGGMHVMLIDLARRPLAGEFVPVRLGFARAGEVSLAANVVTYAEVEQFLATAGRGTSR